MHKLREKDSEYEYRQTILFASLYLSYIASGEFNLTPREIQRAVRFQSVHLLFHQKITVKLGLCATYIIRRASTNVIRNGNTATENRKNRRGKNRARQTRTGGWVPLDFLWSCQSSRDASISSTFDTGFSNEERRICYTINIASWFMYSRASRLLINDSPVTSIPANRISSEPICCCRYTDVNATTF